MHAARVGFLGRHAEIESAVCVVRRSNKALAVAVMDSGVSAEYFGELTFSGFDPLSPMSLQNQSICPNDLRQKLLLDFHGGRWEFWRLGGECGCLMR